MDSNGWLLAVLVTAASAQDRDAGHRLLGLLPNGSPRSRWCGRWRYAGRLLAWATTVLTLAVTIVKRTDNLGGFVVLPRRWVVERTFAG